MAADEVIDIANPNPAHTVKLLLDALADLTRDDQVRVMRSVGSFFGILEDITE